MWERADQAHFRGKGRAGQAGASCMFLLPHRWRICRLNPQPTHWQPVSAFRTKKTLKHGQKHFHLGISQGKKTLNIIVSKQVDSLFQVFALMEADSCLSGSMFTLRGWFQSSYKTQPKTKQHSNHATKKIEMIYFVLPESQEENLRREKCNRPVSNADVPLIDEEKKWFIKNNSKTVKKKIENILLNIYSAKTARLWSFLWSSTRLTLFM